MKMRRAMACPAFLLGLMVIVPGPAAAQAQSDGGTANASPSLSASPESPPVEEYRGVRPGASNLPPSPSVAAKGQRAQLVWVGFEVRAGVPTVFLELTHPVVWKAVADGERLVVHLRSATVPLKNNQRPLLVQEFGTAVREVVARPRGRDVEVVIRLAHEVAHREHLEPAAGGFQLLVIELI